MASRWEAVVEKVAEKYKTPGIDRVTFTPCAVAKLLARQHAAVVRAIRKRGKEYMMESNDHKLSKHMQSIAAARAWAFKDFADDLAALATHRKGRTS